MIACSGAQDLGVADDEGGGETAVKGFNLVLAVGRVGYGRPHGAVTVPAADFPQQADGQRGFFVFVVLRHFRRRSVVRQEHDDCVAAEMVAVQGFQNFPDAPVHDGDLRGVGGHAFGYVFLAFRRSFFIAGRIEFVVHPQLGGRGTMPRRFWFSSRLAAMEPGDLPSYRGSIFSISPLGAWRGVCGAV